MSDGAAAAVLPKPKRKLWRTMLALPRSVKRFYHEVPYAQLYPEPVPPEEVAHWGRIEVLDESLVILHRDGTVTNRSRYVAVLHGDADLKEWEETGVVYHRRHRRPKIVRSVLYLPEGGMQKAVIRNTVIDPQGNRVLVATHSHLRPGVILDHETQDDHFRPYDTAPAVWGEFFLRTRWPCKRRRLQVAVAKPFTLQYRLNNGAPEPRREQVGDYDLHVWEASDTPGVELDVWVPPALDYCPWIDYSTLPDWRPVGDYFRQEVDPGCVQGHVDYAEVQKVLGDARTPREKLERVYTFAAEGVRYGRPQREMEERKIRSGSRIAEDMQGDCKDKSALIVSMLRQADVPADVAVLLSREHGRQEFLPGTRFDHAIVVAQVDGQEVWLDAAAGAHGVGVVPYQDQGARALVLRGDGTVAYRQVPPARPDDHGLERRSTGRLDDEGNYHYDLTVRYIGERAAEMRFRLADRSAEARRRMLQQLEGELVHGAQVQDVEVTGHDDLKQDRLQVTYRVVLPMVARRVRDLLLMRLPWAEAMILSGPLAATTRDVPLLSPAPQRVLEVQEIALPAGHAAYALPFEHREANDWLTYTLRIEQTGDRLLATRTLEHGPGPQLIPPEQYPEFRAAWSRCARADATDVVLYTATAGLG